MGRDDIVCSRLAQQMHGLSWALWERRKNFGVQWTGTDIVPRWCEAKPASFPGWRPFQCHFRFHLNLKAWISSIRNKASQFTASPVTEDKRIFNFLYKPIYELVYPVPSKDGYSFVFWLLLCVQNTGHFTIEHRITNRLRGLLFPRTFVLHYFTSTVSSTPSKSLFSDGEWLKINVTNNIL